jgi:RNA polymerase sigma-70 factor (ECF subfamily)
MALDVDETTLLTRCRQFELAALAEVYDRFSPGIYAYALRLLGDPVQAEDCTSEVFSRLLAAWRDGKGPQTAMRPYLYRMAHNWVHDQYRRQPPEPLALEEELIQDTENSLEAETALSLERQQVRAALQRLTGDQRQVVMLRFIEGWDNLAVAAALDRPVGAVKALQHRALEALRRMLRSEERDIGYELTG